MTNCGRCGKNLLCACEDTAGYTDPKLIVSRACAELRLPESDFYRRVRTQEIAAKRQIIYYLLFSITGRRYTEIARWVNRDTHSTIIYSVYGIMRRMKREPEFARTIARLEQICREGSQSKAA